MDNKEVKEVQKEYWKKNIRIILWLLVVWFLVSLFAGIILAEPLSNVTFFKLPLSFWFAHQGSIIVFVILIFVYAVRMDKLDKEYGVEEVIMTSKEEKRDES
jgi:putative solute:sodium symporter small subunit